MPDQRPNTVVTRVVNPARSSWKDKPAGADAWEPSSASARAVGSALTWKPTASLSNSGRNAVHLGRMRLPGTGGTSWEPLTRRPSPDQAPFVLQGRTSAKTAGSRGRAAHV